MLRILQIWKLFGFLRRGKYGVGEKACVISGCFLRPRFLRVFQKLFRGSLRLLWCGKLLLAALWKVNLVMSFVFRCCYAPPF
jgi:hypothetical protein